ncbi:hypothetical protein [Shigella sonnei]|nr:hypothetical protein [Shigella sonnei]
MDFPALYTVLKLAKKENEDEKNHGSLAAANRGVAEYELSE